MKTPVDKIALRVQCPHPSSINASKNILALGLELERLAVGITIV